MTRRCLPILLLVVIMGIPFSTCLAANPVKMRPYSGIGVAILPGTHTGHEISQPVYLYREPGLSRLGTATISALPGNEWIFGNQADEILLIVMARKGNWLKVCYDDAGREAWINTLGKDYFQPWDVFLKSSFSRMLPGLRKQYYQLYQLPEQNPGVALTPKQPFRVLRLEHDWVMVLPDQGTIGWLRWRDEDGRLTIGLDYKK
jgi:hypothetical protein